MRHNAASGDEGARGAVEPAKEAQFRLHYGWTFQQQASVDSALDIAGRSPAAIAWSGRGKFACHASGDQAQGAATGAGYKLKKSSIAHAVDQIGR